MKQYFYISLLLCTTININFVLTVSETYVNNGLSNQTDTPANKSNSKVNTTTTVILTEGGTIDLTPNIPHHEREGVIISTSTSTTVSTTIETTSNATSANSSTTAKSGSTTTSPSKVTEIKSVTVDYNGDSRVKPRKGVSLNDSVVDDIKPTNPINTTTNINIPVSSTVSKNLTTQKSTTTTTVSTTTLIPRKPTVTYGSDEEDPPLRASNTRLFLGGKEITHKNSSSSVSSPPAHMREDENVVRDRHYAKGSAYVLPIVLTILAVPLLAIILTVVYKRGAEWWNHRHYRRMDFLIDGMYNN